MPKQHIYKKQYQSAGFNVLHIIKENAAKFSVNKYYPFIFFEDVVTQLGYLVDFRNEFNNIAIPTTFSVEKLERLVATGAGFKYDLSNKTEFLKCYLKIAEINKK